MSDNAKVFACDIASLSPDERGRHRLLLERLRGAVRERAELPDGYRFALNAAAMPIVEIAEWLTFEHRCCPFFTLRIEAAPDPEGLSVSILGPAGVKVFIQAALGFGV